MGLKSLLGLGHEPNKPIPIDKEQLIARRAAFAKVLSNKYEAPITPPPEDTAGKARHNRPRFILGSVQSDGQKRTVALVADRDGKGRMNVSVSSPETLADIFDEAKALGLDDVLIDIYGAFSENLETHFAGRTDRRLFGLTDIEIVSLLGPLATQDPKTNRDRLLEVVSNLGNTTDQSKQLEVEARHRLYIERQGAPFEPLNILAPTVALDCVRRLARPCGRFTEGEEFELEEKLLPIRATLLALAVQGQDANTLTEAALTLVSENDDWTLLEALLNEGAQPTAALVEAAMGAPNAEEYILPLIGANGSPALLGDPVRRTISLGNWGAASDLLRAGTEAGGDLDQHPSFDMVKSSQEQSREVFDLFLSNGLDPNQMDAAGVSLLEHAITSGSPLISSLTWYGVDLDRPLTTGKAGREAMGNPETSITVGAPLSDADQDKRNAWARRAGRPIMGPMVIDAPKRPAGYSISPASRKNPGVEI